MGTQDQELLMKETPQKQKQKDVEFDKGGSGGKPFIAFGGSSKSTSVVCSPDPENPGH